MLVEPHGRIPVVPEQLRGELALLLREHVHVTVVVVAHVRMIEIRNWAVLEGRSEVLVEPVGHHDLSVRVQAGHEDEDHVVEDLLHLRRGVRREPMHELNGHLRGADLRRVNAAGDDDDRLAAAEDLVAFGIARRAVTEVQLAFELLVAIEVLQRIGAGDLQRDERIVVRGPAELAEADAIARSRDQAHVLDDLVPARELVVAADPEAEELIGRGDSVLGRQARRQRQRGQHERGDEAAGRASNGRHAAAGSGATFLKSAMKMGGSIAGRCSTRSKNCSRSIRRATPARVPVPATPRP